MVAILGCKDACRIDEECDEVCRQCNFTQESHNSQDDQNRISKTDVFVLYLLRSEKIDKFP